MGDFQTFDPRTWVRDGMLSNAPSSPSIQHKRRGRAKQMASLAIGALLASTSFSFSVPAGTTRQDVPIVVATVSPTATDPESDRLNADDQIVGSPDLVWSRLMKHVGSMNEDLSPDPVDIDALI
jgi:hypothetical protein